MAFVAYSAFLPIFYMQNLCAGLNESAKIIHENNKAKGFWDQDRNVGEALMLVVSELGEAMDAHQKGRFAAVGESIYMEPQVFEARIKDTFEDELADTIIRLLDISAGIGIDIEKHINMKVSYNKTRERLHGKRY